MKLELTKSESEVVKLKALGYAEKEIAEIRFNSIHTIKTHVKRALTKNSINNGFELVARYAASNPDIFKNVIVILFLSIQSLMIIPGIATVEQITRKNIRVIRVKAVRARYQITA